jgi:plasmid replication initiation protein
MEKNTARDIAVVLSNKDDRKLVIQHNDLVNAKYKLTLMEQKFILEIMSSVHRDDDNFETYRLSAKELLEKGIVTDTNTKNLEKFAMQLMSKPLSIPTSKDSFVVFNWFSRVEYKNGYFTANVDIGLKPYLLQLAGNYTQYQKGYVKYMSSQYSVRIYTLLKECFGTRVTRVFVVENLMKRLQIPESLYLYSNFKQRVLDVAVREIRKYTDIETFYKITKQERKKVIEIEFVIKKNEFRDMDWSIYTLRDIALKSKKDVILTKIKAINTDNGYINITYNDNKIEKFQEIQDFFDSLLAAEILLEKDEQKRKFLLSESEKNSFSSIFKALIAYEKAKNKKIKAKQNPSLSLF